MKVLSLKQPFAELVVSGKKLLNLESGRQSLEENSWFMLL